MALTLPTYDQIRDTIQSVWQAARPDADATKYSDLWLYARILADMVYRLHLTADRLLSALHPSTTYGDALDRWLEVCGLPDGQGGYGRIQDAPSSGTSALRVTATGATVDLLGQQLTDTGGRTYEITSSYAFAAAGTHDYDLTAVDVGAATNLEIGETLTFVSPPANVQSTATLVADLSGGTDRETDPEGRERLLQRLRDPGLSGNVSDWRETIEDAAPGEVVGYVWPMRQGQPAGYGYTDFCALKTTGHRDDRHIGLSDDLYSTIAQAIQDRMPAQDYLGARQLTVNAVDQVIQLRISMADNAPASALCDWDAEDLGAEVSAIDATNKRITADTTVTSHLSVGDRVVIGGAQATVTAVGTADGMPNDQTFEVDSWFDTYDSDSNPYPTDPMVGYWICSGGGVIMDVVGALHDLMDSLGPAKGSYAGQITGWEDTLRVDAITTAVVQAGDGNVVGVTIKTPTSDVTPTAGSSAITERLVLTDLGVWEIK